MNGIEIIVIFLAAVCVAAVVAHRRGIPSPILFILAGIGLGFVPGIAAFEIPPEYMLLIFLPLLLMEAAYFTSIRDFRYNLRSILQLAIGLVIVTTVTTAWIFQKIVPDGTWLAGLVLGAIISPPDAIAATAIARQVKMPKRVQTILEGESLVNDAVGLVLYRVAVAAALTGSYDVASISMDFIWKLVSGVSIGVVFGRIFILLFPRIRERSVELLAMLLLPFVAYLSAEAVHSSSVLAVVAAGLVVSWYSPTRFSSAFRLQSDTLWRMTTFILNGIVFVLIGRHIPALFDSLAEYSTSFLLTATLLVSFTAILTRFLWVYIITYGTRLVFPNVRRRDPAPPWQNVFIVAWTGMRGVVSLALALGLPVMDSNEVMFPFRDLIIFIACGVILVTVILQGLTLPLLMRKLSVTYDWNVLHENWMARKKASVAVLERLRVLKEEKGVQSSAFDRILSHYQDRVSSLGDGPSTPIRPKEPPSMDNHPLVQEENRLWQEILDVEHLAVVDLRRGFHISDDVMHDIVRDIDLMRSRFRMEGV
ncbi:MAG: Na+/H+ antiporter [Micavibrio sp.]|nr:Na+/H+ antiporter [Micavibrio sp.]